MADLPQYSIAVLLPYAIAEPARGRTPETVSIDGRVHPSDRSAHDELDAAVLRELRVEGLPDLPMEPDE
jgi:hypothetical protein